MPLFELRYPCALIRDRDFKLEILFNLHDCTPNVHKCTQFLKLLDNPNPIVQSSNSINFQRAGLMLKTFIKSLLEKIF